MDPDTYPMMQEKSVLLTLDIPRISASDSGGKVSSSSLTLRVLKAKTRSEALLNQAHPTAGPTGA